MADRRTLLSAAAVFAVVFMVYALQLPSTPGIGDEAEAQTVPYILGISHPTGFPAYTLLGWLWSHVMAVGTVAWRLNAFEAFCSALGAAGVFAIAAALDCALPAAILAAFAFAFGSVVWHGALHANAQTLAGACTIYVLLACIVFVRTGSVRVFITGCALCGLALATHPVTIWVLPAVALALFWRRRDVTPATLGLALVCGTAPLLLYAYLPLRSAYVATHGLDPDAGAPLFGAGAFDWDMHATRSVGGFLDETLGRREYASHAVGYALDPRFLPRTVPWWLSAARTQYSFWLLLPALAGAIALARSERRALALLVAGSAGGIAFAFIYRNDQHIDRYEFVSFAVVAVLAAAASRLPLRPVSIGVLAVGACLAFIGNRPPPIAPYDDGGMRIDVIRSETPDDAIIVAPWNDATPLGYGAFVDHALGKRLIVSELSADLSGRFAAWAQTRPVIIYRGRLATLHGAPFPDERFERIGGSPGGHGVYRVDRPPLPLPP